MEKLLMLGTTPTSTELIQLAKARGVYTITTDYFEPEQSAAKLVSDEYWMISTADVDALEKKCREECITAVICGLSEFNAERMAELCQRLNLPCWCTPESWDAVQRKHNFKKLCRENNVPVAKDYFLSNPPTEEEINTIVFPVVVKPVDMNSNSGLSYCYNKEDVIKACEYARSLSSNETVIVEKMLHGTQYLAHYALADGEASLFGLDAVSSQPGYPGNCYSFMTTANNQQSIYLKEMDPYVKNMLKAAGCKDGVCWIQLFLDEDGHFYAIEMGYRLSGDMIAVPFKAVTGFDSYAWLLDVALGVKHTAAELPAQLMKAPERCACSYILWSKSEGTVAKIEGAEEIDALPNTRVYYNKRCGDTFGLHRYMMTIVFDADNQEQAIEMVKEINKTIKFYDENGNNPLIYFDDFESVRRLTRP